MSLMFENDIWMTQG